MEVRVEEIHHMLTSKGYGMEWPSQFSVDGDIHSTLISECEKATCVWWQHPENNCPDMLAEDESDRQPCDTVEECTGGCLEPNCNCVEWFQQVFDQCYPPNQRTCCIIERL